MLKKFVGDKAFYKYVLTIALPMMLQNGITNFVNMLDNIMVGRIGTFEMSGVSVANQLIFVFNLCLFGAVSGAGIFGAQYYGKKDNEGLKYSVRFKLILCILITLAGCVLFLTAGDGLINLYLKGEGTAKETAVAFESAKKYLLIMLVGFVPFAVTQTYSSTLRETGETVLPMKAGITAVLVNLTFNYILIFGVEPLSIPRMGVAGAAIATVLSRFVEAIIVVAWTHKNHNKNPYIKGLFKDFRVPVRLAGNMLKKAIPLILNETLWAAGVAFLNQCYSERGIKVVAAVNISQTFWNLFAVMFISMGGVIGIIIGNMLGAGKTDEVMDTARKLTAFTLFICVIMATLFAVASPFIPLLYNTEDDVRAIATGIMLVGAVAMPLDAIAHSTYFTIRSGGKAFITFVFDSGFMWFVSVPVAFVLSRYTSMSIIPLYAVVQSIYSIKSAVGVVLVKQGKWIKNIVGTEEKQ